MLPACILLVLASSAHAQRKPASATPARAGAGARGGIDSVLSRGQARPYSQLRNELKRAASPEEWRAFKRAGGKPYELRGRWAGEDRPGFVSKGTARRQVAYLRSELERAPFRIRVGEDGLLYDARGRRFSCAPESLLVADQRGNLYARDIRDIQRAAADPDQLAFAHSSFLAGAPAEMSVEVHVEDGRLLSIKNRSGHYRPSRSRFVAWLVRLEKGGADLSRTMVSFDPKSTVDDVSGD